MEDRPKNLTNAAGLSEPEVRAALADGLRFPAEDNGRSLASMAQRDLDAALQLLADRAQYITGANGAAIALRRDGKNDMLCRASSGENVPELGALLSMEFGLSGESVRTRKPLRCDDAQRDIRVNQQVCRELGIASVMVMPVVHDDEVLGVFELFSQKPNAFGEGDVSALKRLSEMVDTAVRLAQAVQKTPEQLLKSEVAVAPNAAPPVVTVESKKAEAQPKPPSAGEVRKANSVVPVATELPKGAATASAAPSLPKESSKVPASKPTSLEKPAAVAESSDAAKAVMSLKKPLLWSAADSSIEQKPAETDQSHIPPMLRNLRKCGACGFPISAERTLCVECEEKKWRGQLKPKEMARPQIVQPAEAPQVSAPVARLKAAAQANSAGAAAAPALAAEQSVPPAKQAVIHVAAAGPVEDEAAVAIQPVETSTEIAEHSSIATPATPSAAPELILSAGLPPSQSWASRNRFVVVAIVAVAAVVIILLLR